MSWLGNMIARVPIERLIIPQRDPAKELQEFLATLPRPEAQKERPSEEKPTTIQESVRAPKTVATACVPCALGHFSTSSGLLNEIARFKGDGLTSHEVLDRVAACLAEQNALERVDLTPENIQALPELNRKWFKGRFSHLGPEKAQRIADEVGNLSSEDTEKVMKRVEELAEAA